MASSACLKDVLEVDLTSYEKFKPDIEAILKKRMKKHQQSIMNDCDEIVQLLHISYNGAHPLKQRIIQDFKSRLAFQFSFWNQTNNRSELEVKYADKIPWDDVFRSISEEIRAYTISIIDRYEAEETKLLDGSGDLKDEMSQQFQKRAQSLMSLRNRIKNDQENGDDQANHELTRPDPSLLMNNPQGMGSDDSDQTDFKLTRADLILQKNSAQGVENDLPDGNSSTNGNI